MYYEKYLQVIFVNFWALVYDDDYVIDFGAIHAHILNRKSYNTWAWVKIVLQLVDTKPLNNNSFKCW